MFDPEQTITVKLTIGEALSALFNAGRMSYQDNQELLTEALEKAGGSSFCYSRITPEAVREAARGRPILPSPFSTLLEAINEVDFSMDPPTPQYRVRAWFANEPERLNYFLRTPETMFHDLVRHLNSFDGSEEGIFNSVEDASAAIATAHEHLTGVYGNLRTEIVEV